MNIEENSCIIYTIVFIFYNILLYTFTLLYTLNFTTKAKNVNCKKVKFVKTITLKNRLNFFKNINTNTQTYWKSGVNIEKEVEKMEKGKSQEFSMLLTGFEPFGGEKINPSQEIIRRIEKLSKKSLTNIKLHTMILPVSYKRSIEILDNFYEKNNVDLAIHIGQAGGRSVVELERLAVNLKNSTHPDNDGIVENDSKIIQDGLDAYLTKIDVIKIAEILNLKKKLPVGISYDAGKFICNEVFYFSLHNSITTKNPKHALFIHVPFLPVQVAEKFPKNKNLPSMDLNTQVKIIFEIMKVLQKELINF